MEAEVINYGILALIPPVLAIGLAIWTKNIIVSLFLAVIVSTTIVNGWNPLLGFTSHLTRALNSLLETYMQFFCFLDL